MLIEPNDSREEELQQLWGGGRIPDLTREQIELSLKLWQKIKKRKQRSHKLTEPLEAPANFREYSGGGGQSFPYGN